MLLLRRTGRLGLVAIGLLLAACAAPPTPATGPASAQRHMVVAAHPLAAEAGRDVLRRGGSAVDAAIATQLALNLVEPQSSGIGGGAFLLHYDADRRRVSAYDGRETAPAAAGPALFLTAAGEPMDFREAVVGGRAVGVPGVLRMLKLAHEDHGRLPWAALFRPAVRLAEAGFPIGPRLHELLAGDDELKGDPEARVYFYTADGAPKPVGTVVKNPAFAEVLRRVAAEGPAAFYEGEVAADIVAEVRGHPANPGRLAEGDLAGYRAKRRRPVCAPYREVRVCGMPPPTSGGVAVLQMLGLLERFGLADLEPTGPQAVHLLAEAGRLAFADRNRFLADPDFVDVPVGRLLDRGYLAHRSRLISPKSSLGHAEPGLSGGRAAMPAQPDPPSTSHLSIVDGDGNAVAMTTSIEQAFGAHLMVRGFLLNNELTDFSFRPSVDGRPVANRVEPGKRPRSSMAPTLVLDRDGRLLMAVGSPGGSRIIGYVAKALVASLDWGLDMQAAVALPNFVNRNGATELERGTRLEALVPRLRALGHEVRIADMVSGLHGVRVRPAGLAGGADPRREGVALGD